MNNQEYPFKCCIFLPLNRSEVLLIGNWSEIFHLKLLKRPLLVAEAIEISEISKWKKEKHGLQSVGCFEITEIRDCGPRNLWPTVTQQTPSSRQMVSTVNPHLTWPSWQPGQMVLRRKQAKDCWPRRCGLTWCFQACLILSGPHSVKWCTAHSRNP